MPMAQFKQVEIRSIKRRIDDLLAEICDRATIHVLAVSDASLLIKTRARLYYFGLRTH